MPVDAHWVLLSLQMVDDHIRQQTPFALGPLQGEQHVGVLGAAAVCRIRVWTGGGIPKLKETDRTIAIFVVHEPRSEWQLGRSREQVVPLVLPAGDLLQSLPLFVITAIHAICAVNAVAVELSRD